MSASFFQDLYSKTSAAFFSSILCYLVWDLEATGLPSGSVNSLVSGKFSSDYISLRTETKLNPFLVSLCTGDMKLSKCSVLFERE